MNKEQMQRLAALLSKKSVDLVDAEVTELTELRTKAIAAKVKLDQAFIDEHAPKQPDDDSQNIPVSEEQLAEVVSKALGAELARKGIDQEKILGAIRENHKDGLTVKDIEMAVAAAAKSLGGQPVDTAAIVRDVTAAIQEKTNGLMTQKEFTNALTAFAASQEKNAQRTAPLNQYPDGSADGIVIIEHRSGNLTVAQKQLLNICLKKDINDGIQEKQRLTAERAGAKALSRFAFSGKAALTTGGAGTGAELIPTDLSSDLQMRLYLDSNLAAALASNEISMPTDPFKLPLTTTRTTFLVGAEAPGSDPGTSSPGTGAITLDAKKLIGVAEYSYEAEEDAIVAVLPMLQNDMSQGAAASLEDAIINGDTTATHQDSDTHSVTNHAAKLFKGFRKLALAGSAKVDLTTGGVSSGNLLAVKKFMGKYGVKPSDLLLIFGPKGYNDSLAIDATLTVDKVGNAAYARILTGAAAFIWGVPIVVSEHCRENLNASGVYDGTTTTKGSLLMIHKPSWYLGVRRGFTVETDENKRQQVRYVIASFRRDMQPRETVSTTVPTAVLGYNYAA